MQNTANGTEGSASWNAVDWRRAQEQVNNLRQRIFRASEEGNYRKVRNLQKLMLRSRSNALLAVRRVSQVNRGKDTPGVDMLVVKTPAARAKLVDELSHHQPWRVKPARRVYIPKANGKQRPLGIPTMIDRAVQAVVLNALEPEWEAQFEGISYGFRPGRGCHDAIEKIYGIARPNKRKKWVLDADIKGAFDNIGHDQLVKAIGSFTAKGLIRAWLKSGYVENDAWHSSESGTPQGGVISPLLANIAMHGMENALGVTYRKGRGTIEGTRAVVRYADDFVVFCESKEDAELARQQIAEWLKPRGLSLSEEKTRIVHLQDGFDFLGFNIRHYRAPKTSKSGWKLLIKPSKDAVQRFKKKMKREWMSLLGSDVATVLARLNPIIRGWANYYRTGVSKHTFSRLDNWMFQREVRYAKRTHPHKPWKWISQKYWGAHNRRSSAQWYFGNHAVENSYLLKLSDSKIERHIMVVGRNSPDNPALRDYWAKRKLRKNQNLPKRQRTLADRQKGNCTHCKTTLHNGEKLHVHHKVRRKDGGKDELANTTLIHLLCHLQIHGEAK
jgi:RNA-directed DNA polymerase